MAERLPAELRSLFNFKLPFEGGLNPGRRALTPTWGSLSPYGTSIMGFNRESGGSHAQPGTPKSRFVGIEINSSNVLTGFATLAGASRIMAQFPIEKAEEWRAMVVAETPRGADYRTQPKRYNTAPMYVQLEGAKYVEGQAKEAKRWTTRLVDQMQMIVAKWERQATPVPGSGARARGPFAGDTVDHNQIKRYCDQLEIPYEEMQAYLKDPTNSVMPVQGNTVMGEGRLQQSIQVLKIAKHGASTVSLTSDSYYAWFVEEGYEDTLKPLPIKSKKKNHPGYDNMSEIYAMVPLDQMGRGGDYNYLEDFASTYGGNTTLGEDGANEIVGGRKLVRLGKRASPIPKPGVHMFQKGTAKFITLFETEFSGQIEKMVRLAMEKNITFDAQMKQFRGATGRGNRGSFMSGASASSALNG